MPSRVDAHPDTVRVGDPEHVAAHVPDSVALMGALGDLGRQRLVEGAQVRGDAVALGLHRTPVLHVEETPGKLIGVPSAACSTRPFASIQ